MTENSNPCKDIDGLGGVDYNSKDPRTSPLPSMPHFVEVLRIIQHGLAGNKDSLKGYISLLAEKLEAEGNIRQAKALRNLLDPGYQPKVITT